MTPRKLVLLGIAALLVAGLGGALIHRQAAGKMPDAYLLATQDKREIVGTVLVRCSPSRSYAVVYVDAPAGADKYANFFATGDKEDALKVLLDGTMPQDQRRPFAIVSFDDDYAAKHAWIDYNLDGRVDVEGPARSPQIDKALGASKELPDGDGCVLLKNVK